jgi:glucose-6-phosphate dehydrogenase assembly protein OpcA
LEATLTTSPVNEAVARVEAELAAFWSASSESSGAPSVKVRASTMNFVVVAAAREIPRELEATRKLAETHAGRAFLLAVDGRLAPWEVSTEVNAESRTEGGAVPICHDWVTMVFGAVAAERAPSVVSALALAEVPVVLEVGVGAPAGLVDSIAPRSDRIVVDSAHTTVARIAQIARRAPSIPIADRAFVRTFTFRELTARFFDEARGSERSIRSVTLGRTPGAGQEPAALFLGWLASRLGWTFQSATTAVEPEGRSIEIGIRDEPRADLGPGELSSLQIRTTVDNHPLELCWTRAELPSVVRWTMAGARAASHEHRVGFKDEAWVLVKALDSTEGDRVYREAVLAAADWLARVEPANSPT